jgi:hypothetical protein
MPRRNVARSLVLAPGHAPAALGQADPNQSPLQSRSGAGEVCRLHETALEDLLGFAAGPLGALEIDLGRNVGRLGQYHDAIRTDLQEAAEDGELLLLAAYLDPKHALPEGRDERRVVGQNPHLALAAGHDDLVDVTLKGSPFRSHDLQVEWH